MSLPCYLDLTEVYLRFSAQHNLDSSLFSASAPDSAPLAPYDLTFIAVLMSLEPVSMGSNVRFQG